MEIANQMQALSTGLRAAGLLSHTLNFHPAYLQYADDYTWPLLTEKDTSQVPQSLLKLAKALIPNYDVFHFHFATSLTFDQSDLPLLLASGKQVFMHHWGSEVRRLSVAKQTNPYVAVKITNERFIQDRIKRLAKYIRPCIVSDYELYQYVKDMYEEVHIVPSMIDLQIYQPIDNPVTNS